MFPRAACLVALCLLAACDRKPGRHVRSGPMEPPAFWVWHRSSPLKPAEMETLRANGVRTLYWQAAECEWAGGDWRIHRISDSQKSVNAPTFVHVFRIRPEPGFLGSPSAAAGLAASIQSWNSGASDLAEVQLDFDCPDRLLENYAKFLRAFGTAMAPTRVSITALAGWPENPNFQPLADAVSSLAPMFYDLKADTPDRFEAMADPAVIQLIARWKDCPKPWRAGLPSFERVSVFKADGKLIGHLRGWWPDEVFFHPCLKPKPIGQGMTLFEVTAAGNLAGTRIKPGMKVIHRSPDIAALGNLTDAAERNGAESIIWFALPGPGIPAALSAGQLAHLDAKPAPRLRVGKSGALTLENPGPADLTTRLWELEIRSSNPAAFQSASPGEFAATLVPDGLPADLSDMIVLRFTQLRGGGSLTSGPLLRDSTGLTWSIRGLTVEQALKPEDSAR